MERLAAAYDLGLCGEPGHTANNNNALSNKLFSFLLAGVPPLMSDTRAQTKFAIDAGIAYLIYPKENADALARLMDSLLNEPERLYAVRDKVWSLAQERYNWEQEEQTLLETVTAVIRNKSPSRC
jgi:glycosyltransferase involved in cell wall biosynthesis